jgi:(p)ppGpp synthase/HD superfamily hydrolase
MDTGPALVQMAKGFAIAAHIKQSYGTFRYVKHLSDVVEILQHSGFGEGNHYSERAQILRSGVLAAGWLHDVLEDTTITVEDLLQNFGIYVSDLVWAVTDEPGANRKERKAKTLAKTAAYGQNAIAVKLADRIANVRSSRFYDKKKFKMYREEQGEFERVLMAYGPGSGALLPGMWKLLHEALMVEE